MPDALPYNASLSEAQETSQAKGLDRKNNLSQNGNNHICKLASNQSLSKGSSKVAFTLAEVFSTLSAGKRKIAFTLAEVLITLGIIGVVAALTLPTLIQNYKEKQTVVKLKKTYAILQNAFNMVRMQQHDGTDIDSWGDDYRNFSSQLANYLNVAKFCPNDTYEDCFSNTVTNLNGVKTQYIYNNSGQTSDGFILNDGISLLIYMFPLTSSNFLNYKLYGQIIVDINGKLPPNILGHDVFSFYIYKDRIVPRGLSMLTEEQEEDTANKTTYCDFKHTGDQHNGLGCTAHVINEENMDYLKK